MKRAHSRFSDLGTERFFGTGEVGRRERNWFALNLCNIGLKSGQEKNYRLCGELFRICAEYYGIIVNGEIEGNNLMTTLANDYTASINRVTWSPDGKLFGVAYSKSLMQIYSYHGGDDIRNHLEIQAHAGSVNDLAFAYPNKILSIVTCGDDKLIKTSPFVRFNKDGMLLAVLIHANGIKILANPDGVGLLRTTENSSFDPSGVASTPVAKGQVCHLYLRLLLVQTSAITTFGTVSASGGPSTTDKTPSMPHMTLMNSEKRNLVDRPRIRNEAVDKSRMWKVTEISEPSQCLSLRLPDNTSLLMQYMFTLFALHVTNLVYTNSGLGVLALVANDVHKLWKWQKNDRNTSRKVFVQTLITS
ncbi:topless-related protein 4-like protein isoform X1 [Tanacetum coccineum]